MSGGSDPLASRSPHVQSAFGSHVVVPPENDVRYDPILTPLPDADPNLDGGFDANFDDMPGLEGETAGDSDGIPELEEIGEADFSAADVENPADDEEEVVMPSADLSLWRASNCRA